MAFNPYSLEGKTVLVTGASSGIGKATAIACSRLGAHVIVSGRNSERLQETFSELDGEGHLQIIADLTDEDQTEEQAQILQELLPTTEELPYLQAPVYFDYGCNTFFGKFSSANFNFTCLDVCEIHIGDNVMIGPNVTLATPMHPLLPEERNIRKREDGSFYNLEYAKPITIKDNCWLASNVVVCGGVTIGEGCVIGAGSVVTRDIPPYSLAAGNPCRVIRKITEKDHMPDGIEKN